MLDESSNYGTESPEPQPEEKGNRSFLLIAGGFAVVIFLTLVCIAVYLLVIRPRTAATQASQEATAEAQRIEQAQVMTQTAEAAAFTPTLLPSPIPSRTPTYTQPAATDTLVVVVSTPLASPEIVTQIAMDLAQTQLAGQMTQTAAALGTITSGGEAPLPTTGFFDDVGLPLLIVLTFALLVVIFITRRMRQTPR
jgi:hypothetical protein